MGYEGGHLSDFFPRRVVQSPDRTMRRMADRGGEVMTDKTQRKTPVDTGAAKKSIRKKRTRTRPRGGVTIYESGTFTELHRVLWLEHGTQPHVIRAKKGAMAFDIGGVTVFAKEVNHPGMRGVHMFAVAAAETEAEFETLMEPIAADWARQVEAEIGYRR